MVLVALAFEGGPRRWRQALSSLGCCRGGGADRGRGTARCWEWCSGCWGSSGGRSSNRRRASPIDQCLRSSARECGTLPLAFVLFSFFFTLLSLADELLSAAARPVSRICIGGENSLSASARKTLEASKKKKSRVCQSSPAAAVSLAQQPELIQNPASDCLRILELPLRCLRQATASAALTRSARSA